MKRLSKNAYLLYRLKKFASIEALKLFFDAHINSFVNYASTLYDNCSSEYMKRINSVHRRAVKIILPSQNIPTDDKFKKLNILPLDKQLFYNKAVITHKIYYNYTPPYLSHLITKASERYGSNRLSPSLPRIDICKSSLAYSGAVTWNSIPPSIRQATSISTFKKLLRVYLLDVH